MLKIVFDDTVKLSTFPFALVMVIVQAIVALSILMLKLQSILGNDAPSILFTREGLIVCISTLVIKSPMQ